MRYALLGLAVGLSAYLLASSALALLVALIYRLRAPQSAAALFALRMLPAAGGLFLALALVAPAYLKHEPRATSEPLGIGLLALVACTCLFLGLALRRGLRAFGLTRRLSREWRRVGRPVQVPGLELEAYAIEHRFPLVAVVGLRAPTLFVARQVLERLSPAELAAVARHEAGHVAAWDNLRMTLARCAPDWLSLVSLGARLCAAFGAAAERDADDRAAQGGPQALDLAAALLSVARLVPPGGRLALPVSAFHDGDALEPRVTRLLARASGAARPRRRASDRRLVLALAALLLLPAAWNARTLEAVHALVEFGVRALHF